MKYKSIAIDQNMGLFSDAFTLIMPTPDVWNCQQGQFDISLGYGGQEITVQGLLDEINITKNMKEFTCSVKCRDSMKYALQSQFRMLYLLNVPASPPVNEFGISMPYKVGATMASQVAADACNAAGLGVSWGCPDYPVVTQKVTSKGYDTSVADVLSDLTRAVSKTDMFKVDIYSMGGTVYVNKRGWPNPTVNNIKIFGPDADIRVMQFSLTKTLSLLEGGGGGGSAKLTPIRNIYTSREESVDPAAAATGGNTTTPATSNAAAFGKPIVTKEIVNFYRRPQSANPGLASSLGIDSLPTDAFPLLLVEVQTTTYQYLNMKFTLANPLSTQTVQETKDNEGTVLTRKVITTYSSTPTGTSYAKIVNCHIETTDYAYSIVFDPSQIGSLTNNPTAVSPPKTIKTEVSDTFYVYSADDEILSEDIYKTTTQTKEQTLTVQQATLTYPPPQTDADGNPLFDQPSDPQTYNFTDADGNVWQDYVPTNSSLNYKVQLQNVTSEHTSTTYKRITKDLIEIETQKFLNNARVDTQTRTEAGQLPGPKKVGDTVNVAQTAKQVSSGGGGGIMIPTSGYGGLQGNWPTSQVLWYNILPVNNVGKDVRIKDDRLTRGQLLDLAQEMRVESLATKYEVKMSVVATPWIKKGDSMTFIQPIPVTVVTASGKTTQLIDISNLNFMVNKVAWVKTEKEFVGNIELVAYDVSSNIQIPGPVMDPAGLGGADDGPDDPTDTGGQVSTGAGIGGLTPLAMQDGAQPGGYSGVGGVGPSSGGGMVESGVLGGAPVFNTSGEGTGGGGGAQGGNTGAVYGSEGGEVYNGIGE
jgi:hypothetical protein